MIGNISINKQRQDYTFIDLNIIKHLIHMICDLFNKRIGYLSTYTPVSYLNHITFIINANS